MGYTPLNLNPKNKNTGDCVVRAVAKALGISWDEAYVELMVYGYIECEFPPNSNRVWGNFLADKGFEFHSLMRDCRECYTINDFCRDHPKGTYVLGTDTHACTVIDGTLYDIHNNLYMTPMYYFEKIEKE